PRSLRCGPGARALAHYPEAGTPGCRAIAGCVGGRDHRAVAACPQRSSADAACEAGAGAGARPPPRSPSGGGAGVCRLKLEGAAVTPRDPVAVAVGDSSAAVEVESL